jgi:hypothetical protein
MALMFLFTCNDNFEVSNNVCNNVDQHICMHKHAWHATSSMAACLIHQCEQSEHTETDTIRNSASEGIGRNEN